MSKVEKQIADLTKLVIGQSETIKSMQSVVTDGNIELHKKEELRKAGFTDEQSEKYSKYILTNKQEEVEEKVKEFKKEKSDEHQITVDQLIKDGATIPEKGGEETSGLGTAIEKHVDAENKGETETKTEGFLPKDLGIIE